ncbi:MAG: hypothetical protein LH478_15720 [Chitinophagaceae bacterium]|nr:hypothetical protein [Chitinophagaceae bacterium]
MELINREHWCQNRFQVPRQVSMELIYRNRYDVTLLMNGLTIVQIELKRRGLELKKAFNQTNRYQRHSYTASHGLFSFLQVFVISNGVNTKPMKPSPCSAIRKRLRKSLWNPSRTMKRNSTKPYISCDK